jgi:membrane-bound lytic murein transglycosylase D
LPVIVKLNINEKQTGEGLMVKLRCWVSFAILLSFFVVSCSLPVHSVREEPLHDYRVEKERIDASDVSVSTDTDTQKQVEENVDETDHSVSDQTTQSNENAILPPEEKNGDDSPPNGKQQRQAQEEENMDEALDLLSKSQILWEKGELDNALNLLDQAYSLILDVDGEPDIAWQKDDLRFMIAKRILEIYTSRSKVAAGSQSEIPLTMNADVEKEIRRFQRSDRRFFFNSYKRSGKYRSAILKHLKDAGLPEELSWLPLVESGFKINALSPARALGLWQIIPSTGYRFGLKRNHWIDDRMDLEKSTKAAIAYLKALHGIFGDWLTVLAAYNCGEGRVLRVISRQHMNYLDNFWDLYRQLPFETSRYVPRFLAVLHILKNPKEYGFDLSVDIEKPVNYEIVTTRKCMRLKDIARYLKVSKDQLIILNSELRYKVTPGREYNLKIPAGMAQQFTLIANKIPKSKIPGSAAYLRHKIRTGEALSTIARKYKTSVRSIVRANHLTSKHRIRAGKWLKIPLRGYSYIDSKTIERTKKILKYRKGKTINYRVKKGNSIWLLAKRYDTTVSEIKRMNGLRNDRLKIGQIIKIRSGTSRNTYVVRKGDCVASIANKYHISIPELIKLNSFAKKDNIYPGQVIIVAR